MVTTFDGECGIAISIHDVDIGYGCETVFLSGLEVVGCGHAVAGIGGVAFDEVAINQMYEVFD